MNERSVRVNVYDIQKSLRGSQCLQWVGMGLFHTGVVVGNVEYTFGATGIVHHKPREAQAEGNGENSFTWKCELDAGTFRGSHNEVMAVIRSFRESRFGTDQYDGLERNCNHFSSELAKELTDYDMPAWVNRAANVGGKAAGLLSSVKSVFRRKSPTNTPLVSAQEGGHPAPGNADGTKRRELTDKQRALLENMKRKV